ncbi:zinc-binding metallopeptidase [Adhaeribacter pallidiroseus]|uniref:Substrate import-associated zinc metallohydrolase lipoprotein n=1 Tax=Adhaeribacter pallidiroseus TaxID=2072847 RepID=A0A369QLG1_9BACT|nr:putative zinc-binding metallopeptidase [Adhaeribacter pallidiroseus]RDC65751.1 hypothetical protein AHMF7616_04381 [Adhaeribacter pallidiroseus]
MQTTYIKLIVAFLTISCLTACSKEEELDVDVTKLTSDTWVKGPLDTWLYDNMVVPYNIEVKYRFDRYELSLGRNITPPREDRVIPVIESIKKTWIAPYDQIAGPAFIKRLSPKQFVLVGSPEYNTNGTITLGTAEGGRKIVLFKLNDFATDNKREVKQMLHTIHHEFGHILHQNIMYPQEFKRITPSYTASWNDFDLADANSRGFVTEYSRSNPDDDFVEMISIMLIEGRTNFDAMVNGLVLPDPNDPTKTVPNTAARAALRQKEQMIVRYFKESWNIDFYTLQLNAQAAINAL